MFSVSSVGTMAGGGAGTPAALPDPIIHDSSWGSVVLYSRMEDDPPLDLSISAHTFTDGGAGATLDTTNERFGNGCRDYDSSSTAYDQITDHADWNLGAGDFTIECWVRFDADPGATDDSYFVSQWDTTGNQRSWALYLQNDTIVFDHSTNGTAETSVSVAWTPVDVQWYNVVVTRTLGILRIYIDGQIVTVAADSATYHDSTAALRVGTPVATGDGNFQRNIDEVRVTKGVARYG